MVFLRNWWLSYPSETYESQLGLLFPILYGKIKNDPNHQPGKNINKNIGISYLWRYPDGFTANKTMEKTIVNFSLDPRKPWAGYHWAYAPENIRKIEGV